MENPVVNTPREAPPNWARPDQRTQALGDEPTASQPQLNWIRDLIVKKDLSPLKPEERDALNRILGEENFWDERTTRLSRKKASAILDKLLKLHDKPREQQQVGPEHAERLALGVPAGRYAVHANNGELRFYHVWISRDKKRLNVYVLHGPDESDLKYQKTVLAILKKIKKDIRAAAITYGLEIGSCSNCGRRLTNHISRALGIGPVCGSRMFGTAEWKAEVKGKRYELIAAGINPDEEIDD